MHASRTDKSMHVLAREELEVGAEAQIMPCNAAHAFHPPCLAPWLAEHNSCPVCRYNIGHFLHCLVESYLDIAIASLPLP